jgi:hypothetical protein
MVSDELSLRVGQLGSVGTRTRIAHALREAVELASGHRSPLLTTRLRRPEIQENSELLRALADRLGDGEPLGVKGLAMTACLLHDRRSPLYRSGASASLPTTLVTALGALEQGQRTAGTAERSSAARKKLPGADANLT